VDLLGQIIRTSPEFRGKWRLIDYWIANTSKDKRIRKLPGGAEVLCDLSVPYEAMVWLEREEQNDLELLRHLLRRGQTFVDCGANVGIWSLVAATTVGEFGRVYAFEPNPHTFQKLSYNVSMLATKPALYNLAVGAAEGMRTFECSAAHNISRVTDDMGDNLILVRMTRLDSILEHEVVNGIKIDVEGLELEVLTGGEGILREHKPWLCVEFNTLLAGVDALNKWPVHLFLRDFGYSCRRFQDALDLTTKTLLPDAWRTRGYCNLFYSYGPGSWTRSI